MNNATSSLDFAKRLIAFDTVSRGSNEAVTDEIAQLLDDFGFDIERVDYDDAHGVRKSCVVGKKGQGQGKAADRHVTWTCSARAPAVEPRP